MEYKPSFSDDLYLDVKPSYNDSLMHHGIEGMKWGVRRYQNEDGSLTPAGKKRYNETLILMNKADTHKNKAKEFNKQITSDMSTIKRARLMAKAANEKRKADKINNKLDKDMVHRIKQDVEKTKQIQLRDKELNAYHARGRRVQKARVDAYKQVFKKDKVNFIDIYKEMGADLNNDDNDYYKEVEAAWREKHGFKPLSQIK